MPDDTKRSRALKVSARPRIVSSEYRDEEMEIV